MVLGRITYRMSDRRHTRIAYQIETAEGPRIVSAEEVLDGTWADRAGMRRPTTHDERAAYARILGEDLMESPERPALPVKDSGGGIELPDPWSQDIGYLRTGDPDQAGARTAWQRVLTLATHADRTTLALAAMFAGPLISSLKGVPAHILNLTGGGQLGKSTTQRVMCALMGDPSEAAEVMGTMNSTGMALPELLIEARYLPMCREETSSSTLSLPELEKMFSRVVAGGKRTRLGRGSKVTQSVGTWHSVFVTSSNESLHRVGQVESLASRLIQLAAPFFRDGEASAEAWDLAAQFHGWPLVWARDAGAFTAEGVARWRELHIEILARLTTEDARQRGGIPLTLARIVAAWCVGAYLLGEVLGMPELGSRAEEDAVAVLPDLLGDAIETHLSPGQVLWEAIAGAIVQEPAAWVPSTALAGGGQAGWSGGEYTPRRVLGYYHQGRVHVYVATLKDAARAAGIDTPVPGLKELQRRGVLVTQERTKLASKHPTRELREQLPGRVYIFDQQAAQDAFADRETPPQVTPDQAPVPADGSVTAASEQRAADAPTPVSQAPAVPSQTRPDQAPESAGGAAAARAHEPTSSPADRVWTVSYDDLVQRAVPVADPDPAWERLAQIGQGRTQRALRIGVLGAMAGREGLWLYLPNRVPVMVPSGPESLSAAVSLMEAFGLQTLWLHETAAAAFDLPAYDPFAGGPQAGRECEWAARRDGIVSSKPETGVSAWTTVETESGQRLMLAIPRYEDRTGGPDKGWRGAPTPAALLDALMVYLTTSTHGSGTAPRVTPYYLSPNRTGEDVAKLRREDVWCEAIRTRQVPPLKTQVMVPQKWARAAAEVTDAERAAPWVQKYDRTAAYLAAFGNTMLGIGEPVHTGRTNWSPSLAGWWRVADAPAGLPLLPDLLIEEADQGGAWLSTPDLQLLQDLHPDWTPEVVESWHWPVSKRALEPMYKKLARQRREILAARDAGREGAAFAKHVNGAIYKSFRGYLGRREPKLDVVTGELYAQDTHYRPDWAKLLLCTAMANTYRSLVRIAEKSGRYPLSLATDAATYAAWEADPAAARPEGMAMGEGGGQWTSEGTAPMSEILPKLDAGQSAHDIMRGILRNGGDS